MKHTAKVTALLLMVFVLAQVVGLFAINTDLNVVTDDTTGKVVGINYSEPAIGERPDISAKTAFWYIVGAVLIGTLILLALIKYNQVKIWKAWFFLAVWMTITVTLGVFVNSTIAYILALIIAIVKIYKPNLIVHNLAEVLMYSGIAILFVPLLNVYWVLILLLAISVYDAYAVWKSKHMVDMANFQTKSKVFAGLSIPYGKQEKKESIKLKIPKSSNYKTKSKGQRVAILGGGDIAFPLIFSGAVMQSLILDGGLSKSTAFLETQIITVFVTIALGLLLTYGKKDKFYPAMPFLTAGCLIGYGILLGIQFLI